MTEQTIVTFIFILAYLGAGVGSASCLRRVDEFSVPLFILVVLVWPIIMLSLFWIVVGQVIADLFDRQ